MLTTAGQDQAIKLWTPDSGQEIATLVGHPCDVGSVAFSADDNRLASAGFDYTIKIWSSQTE